jgi:hypothetical protein
MKIEQVKTNGEKTMKTRTMLAAAPSAATLDKIYDNLGRHS